MAEKQNSIVSTKAYFGRDDVKAKFGELMGKRSTSFITSLLQIVSQNGDLQKCDPQSIYQSAMVAAALDLPLNSNLGFAYIVSYNSKQKDGSYKNVAQFQMGYKGIIQLAQRSGQYQTISVAPIYKDQIISTDPLKGYVFDFSKMPKKDEKPVGFASYFKLINGFEKILYKSVEELTEHGKKFSKSFKNNSGLWKDEFEGMASKTMLKLLLSKYGPLSVEMQKALVADQAIINDADTMDVDYEDNDAAQAEAKEAIKQISDNSLASVAAKINTASPEATKTDLSPEAQAGLFS